MSQIVEFSLSSGNILVEVDEIAKTGEKLASPTKGLTHKAKTSFQEAWEAVTPAIEQAAKVFDNLAKKPEQVEIEFGIKLSGEVGAFIAKAESEANFKVKVVWKSVK